MPGTDLPRRPRTLAAAGLLLTAVGVLGCSPPSATPAATSSQSADSAPVSRAPASRAPGEPTSCEYLPAGAAARPVDPPPAGDVETTGTVKYTLAMTGGDVTITMDRSKAPCTVNSFVSLAEQGYFDNTACHRLGDSGLLVLQCGDPTGSGSGGPGYTFSDELTGQETYKRGVVAMANAGPDTNGSQFFLVWEDSQLNPDFTVFGKMDSASRDVVASMAGEGQDGSWGDGTGRPNNPSEITKVTKG
ncbi:MAG: Probable peptidyl-prolyl cis-trans isomerase B (PPIase B) (Rotamase B) [uncultured Friedmanniella sp.]|uniref:Peptidyl-prolyl cis-trans isomerase n=1 Tax=uncultured Friedmanniella sp. TaxID=335381 RepID=A0A6J4JZH0_9ACTN|nr:peptidylprolyl isomerase [uncultured Friedmanniella sp.]CAA9291790.1 MAG: Probable peptidyl-prolyl cis-trans isomerase B (PPIase B) (Rotamase B) [uncultured Friedmanniella sp.]